jgi:hypothetical protein
MFRRLIVGLVALGLVPVLVLGAGVLPAQAQTGSSTATIQLGSDIQVSTKLDYVKCNVTGWWDTSASSATLKIRYGCDEGFADRGVTLNLNTGASPNCGPAPSYLLGTIVNINQGAGSGTASFSPTVDPAGGCNVTQLCYFGSVGTAPPFPDWTDSGCVDWPVGPPGSVSASCPQGSPELPVVGPEVKDTTTDPGYRHWDRDVTYQITGTLANNWIVYAVVAPTQGGGFQGHAPATFGPTQNAHGTYVDVRNNTFGVVAGATSNYDLTGVQVGQRWYWGDDPGPAGGTADVIGAGVFARPTTGTLNDWGQIPVSDSASGLYGITDASQCAFYWGAKIAEKPSSTTDNPLGTLDAAPPASGDPGTVDPPGDTGCDFSWTDPSSWASGAACALTGMLGDIVGVLKSILHALQSLASNIVQPIVDALNHLLDGLQSLFVPDTDSWGLGDLADEFSSRPPGSIVTAIVAGVQSTADAFNGGTGCGTIADFTNSDTHGSAKLTCSAAKSTPGYAALYNVVKFGLIALTVLGMWYMAAGAFKSGRD